MKVVQINAVYGYSSTGRTTTEMHEYMLEHAIQSYVFCINVENPEKNIYRIGHSFDYKIHSLCSHLFGNQGFYSYFPTKKLLKQLEYIKPDVVHLRVLHSNFINLPLLLKYLAKKDIGVVLTFHDCWYLTGHCCYFVDSNCNKWQDKCGNCPDLRNWNTSYFFDRSASNLEMKRKLFGAIDKLALVAVSDWVKSFFDNSILKNAKIKTRIYNWIDLDKFKPQNSLHLRKEFGLENKFVILGVAQNWTPTKGLDDIISIAKQRRDFTFLIIGNIPKSYILCDNIVSVGVLSDVNQLTQYYSMVDVFFNPSMRETFGKVTLEALACGTPVVGYKATATPELIPDGCGYIVDVHDTKNVIDKLEIIKNNTKSYYSDNCREWTKLSFSKENLIAEYLHIYKKLKEE